MNKSSYGTILRTSSILGSTKVINVLVSLVKVKIVAVLLGPVGVGLVGLYMNLMQTASTVAGLGISNPGTRQIAMAQAEGKDAAIGRVRTALLWGTVCLAFAGGFIFWLVSGWIARELLADETLASDMAWLSLGVILMVGASSQGALLTGMRRIGDLARINVVAGVISAGVGVFSIWLWGEAGLLVSVLVVPASTFLLGQYYAARIKTPVVRPVRLSEMSRDWGIMVRLGGAFMLSGLVTTLSHLTVRGLVQKELGAEYLGYFQAAWVIGMTYLGFVLGAMGQDYYPRLAAVISDQQTAVRLVNEQTEVAILLSTPVLLIMLGFAPWLIPILYSAEFAPAVEILRWQLLGDLLKVISWPLGFIIMASGAGKVYMLTETFAAAVFVLVTLALLPLIGVIATGVAFLTLYVCYLPVVWWFGGRRIGLRWTLMVKSLSVAAVVAALLVVLVGHWSEFLGAVFAVLLAAAMSLWALLRLVKVTGTGGRIGRAAALVERVTGLKGN